MTSQNTTSGGADFAYLKSHPWLRFESTYEASPQAAMALGEAWSKCEHLRGAPLDPAIAENLYEVYLVKGAVATTAIEGNTLTEEQVLGARKGEVTVPASQEYQLQEVRNVLDALVEIDQAVRLGNRLPLDRARLDELNRRVLDGTEHEPSAIPGEIRQHSVTVGGRYRGAPPEDLEYLIDRLCAWLDSPEFQSADPMVNFARTVVKAIVAHVYIAWIHPYGDGNGRTARLVEAQILSQGGVPLPAINLLSDHYNSTRSRYARELARTSEEGTLGEFIDYAIYGFVDGLRQHVEVVRQHQVAVAFTNYVHNLAATWPQGVASKRKRDLVLALNGPGAPTPRFKLTTLTEDLASDYAGTTEKTLTRDLNFLRGHGLIRLVKGGWIQNVDIIRAWLPPAMLPLQTEVEASPAGSP